MHATLITALIGFAPVPVIYFFYLYYFSIKRDVLHHLEYFAYGMLLAPLVLFAGPYLVALVPAKSVLAQGFLQIALVEKAGAFAVVFLLMRRSRARLTVSNAVACAMFLGMGFAAVENVVFAATASLSVLLVRFMSAVPLHVLSCGLIGYYLALRELSSSRSHRAAYFAVAVAVPVFFHGMYDSLILLGGSKTFLTAGLLFLLMALMELNLAKSQVLPLLEGLAEERLSLEDWQTIERQQQFERWIQLSMGARNVQAVPFFRYVLSRVKMVVVAGIVAFAAWFLIKGGWLVSVLGVPLTGQESLVVFVLIPVLYAAQLVLVGVVNPDYFKYSVIRIPVIIDTVMSLDVDAAREDDVVDAVTYHITGLNAFVKTAAPLAPGTRVRCILYCSRFSSPALECEVAWDHHAGPEPLNGTLVRFMARPAGFWVFLARYYFFRVSQGIVFALRLPGYRAIRRHFVRPVSVMQDEAHFPAGHVLFRQGDPGDRFYLVLRGMVDIYKTFRNGRRVLMTTLTRGDIFGEMALVGNQPRLATAECRTDCLVAIADPDNLDALIRGNPDFTRTLIETFAARFHETDAAMFKNLRQMNRSMRADRRFLGSLARLLLSGAYADPDGDGAAVAIDIDGRARALGCDREKVRALLRVVNESENEEELINGVDSALRDRIVKAFGAGRIELREKR